MKKTQLFGTVLIAAILIGCCFWILWTKFGPGKNGQGYLWVPNLPAHLPPVAQLRKQGETVIVRIQGPAIIDGFPCSAGWVHFYESGRVKAFYLDETNTIQGNQIPKGTWIQLNPDQTLRTCFFPEDTNIQGYLCDGGAGGSEGVTTGFFPSGRLASFYPPEDVEIQGIPCKASLISGIYLYENGNLKEFTLSRDAVIAGRSLSGGQTVVLDERGEVQSVMSPSMYKRTVDWVIGLFR
ncbi:MAG: hypothetical protein JXA73_03675 [Acidobacteria bacterium]|nr:hypothetical protein [Acidobacteriota bacterium]